MIDQLVHVNIVVSDIERSLPFYTEVLGARVVRDWWGDSDTVGRALGISDGPAKWHAYMLRFGDGDEHDFPQIDLLQWIDPEAGGRPYDTVAHIGIPRIALHCADCDALYERAQAFGAECLSEPLPMNSSTSRGSQVKVLCIKDPDGTIIEAIGPLRRPSA